VTNDEARVAAAGDATTVTNLIVEAFLDDPTWSWAYPDPATRRARYQELWGLIVEGALRYPWVWLAADGVATSVWIPPGGTDLSDEQEHRLEALLAAQPRSAQAFDLFEAAHPRDVPHYYLSLLATDPAHRGHGYGLRLLADNLRHIDDEGAAAYLEASNPVNVALYERYGFEVVGSFELPDDGGTVHRMWRDPRG
jgi:ribosomal protein S18 acetylase RimI-like enzyme